MSPAERLLELQADVDVRLAGLWGLLWRDEALDELMADDDARAVLGASLRTAYALGYREALEEDSDGRRGQLHEAHGYAVP